MRVQFSIIFAFLIVALIACAVIAWRSHKTIGKPISRLLFNILTPVLGNLIIIQSKTEGFASVGCYTYYIGMDCMMITLMQFIFQYCSLPKKFRVFKGIVYGLCTVDVIQFALNPFFHHAFKLEEITVDNAPYFRMIPLLGQNYHRIIDYSILAMVLLTLIIKVIRTPRIYSERYWVILLASAVTAIWQTYYIFSRTPVDRSMIGFGAYGIMYFYFSLYYRPMRLLDKMLANIASEMPEAVIFFDANERAIWANRPAKALLQITDETLDTAPVQLNALFGTLESVNAEWHTRRSVIIEGKVNYFVLEMHPVPDERKKVAGAFLSIRDNTEEQLRLRQEVYNATHDTLTDLFTREYLHEQIGEMLTDFPKTRFLIGFLDVKNFKIINDIFSNAFGDFALKSIAEWLAKEMSEHAVYGRLGGDTFGFMMPKEEFDREHFENELARFSVNDGTREYHLLIHVGLYAVMGAELSVPVMFDRAHLALTQIKDEFQKHIAFYDDELRKQVLWSQRISTELPQAIAEEQIQPYLQPIVDKDGKVVGAEALARWIHPKEGFLAPYRFIPVLEKNGMIVEIDRHMWRCACRLLKKWSENGCGYFISVNISPKDFYFIDVFSEISALVKEYDVNPHLLRIEITETVMMNESDDRMQILTAFRNAGFIVEMDDFGSGYSSLNMLKDMPVDVVKLDMKFLSRSENNERAETILRNIINLTKDLGLSALTEGVETAEQYQMLNGMGCGLFQGYHFAKPLSVEEFETRYKN